MILSSPRRAQVHAPSPTVSSGRRRAVSGLAALAVGLTTALAVVPSAQVAAAAEPAPIPAGAWVDSFDGPDLASAWSVVSEVPTAWSLSTPGVLTLTSQPGDTYQTDNTADNVFMVDVPVGDFTAITSFTAPVALDYQGAGIIAWKDMDNYVRSGLSHVGFATGGPVVIEAGREQAASYSSTFTARPGSTSETLRLQRTGDTITTSYWDGTAWIQAASVTVAFDVTQVGLYALAAQNGTSHTAAFDYFAVDAADGQDQVPDGTFTLNGEGEQRYLASTDDGLSLVGTRPTAGVGLVATPAGTATGTVAPITLADASSDLPVVVDDGRLAFGADGADGQVLRMTDAGGGKVVLRTVGDEPEFVGVRVEDGALVLTDADHAVRLTVTTVSSRDAQITIDTSGPTTDVSDDLYGIFYEDINYAADGGLYAELVRNRSFEFNTSDNAGFTGMTAWTKVQRSGATGTTTVGTGAQRLNDSNRYYLTVESSGPGVGVSNAGYNTGLFVEKDAKYDFSVWARSATAQTLAVSVENAAGTSTYGAGTVAVDGSDVWKKYTVTLTGTGTTSAGRLVVVGGAAGTLRLDMVSLFPQDTWVGPVNGRSPFRKDLAEKIAALDPKFLRFPGGCVTNVGTFDTYLGSDGVDRKRTYQWKETLGPVEERATNWNFWGYNQSYGIGYLEYFELAEDLGAVALPVLSVGANGCGSAIPDMTDATRIDRWVQDTVDLIEFATGDTTTTWGAKRAALGHPEPFEMKYIGLGNEENHTTFEANFPKFRDAIEARYPDIKIISNSGPDDSGARFDTLWEYNKRQGVDLVDEHYYNSPSWFLANTHRYDDYDREGPHVFLGEYASQGNTFGNAISEAAYMTGLERNSDVVELASYAPLLANESYVQWSPDAIWFDNDESWGSANYYVQKMFSTNQGDEVVPSTLTTSAADGAEDFSGGVFLSTWSTSAAYDDVKVTDTASGSALFTDGFTDASQWASQTGSWAVTGGEYVQSSTSVTDARSIVTGAYAKDWSNYTLELDARKISGSEGFLVGFAAGGPNNYFWWNVGGWNNTRSVLQKADGGSANEVAALESTSVTTGKDYHLKVVVDGRTIELYLDGVLQITYTEPAPEALYQVVTRDEDTGDVVLKVVNPTADVSRTAVTVDGTDVAPEATVTEMVGAPTATNTKADKTAIVPVDRELSGVSGSFTYDFPAYSITFVRMHEAVEPDPVVLDVTAAGRCVGTNAYVAVKAVNGGDAPAEVSIVTPYGTKTATVAPGKALSQTFNARTKNLAAGSVTVTGTQGDRSTDYPVAYPATACG